MKGTKEQNTTKRKRPAKQTIIILTFSFGVNSLALLSSRPLTYLRLTFTVPAKHCNLQVNNEIIKT